MGANQPLIEAGEVDISNSVFGSQLGRTVAGLLAVSMVPGLLGMASIVPALVLVGGALGFG